MIRFGDDYFLCSQGITKSVTSTKHKGNAKPNVSHFVYHLLPLLYFSSSPPSHTTFRRSHCSTTFKSTPSILPNSDPPPLPPGGSFTQETGIIIITPTVKGHAGVSALCCASCPFSVVERKRLFPLRRTRRPKTFPFPPPKAPLPCFRARSRRIDSSGKSRSAMSEKQETNKSEDKKDIEAEERERMLNEENRITSREEAGEAGKTEVATKEGMEVKPKKIPIGGIQMPGFFTRSRSREKCKVCSGSRFKFAAI